MVAVPEAQDKALMELVWKKCEDFVVLLGKAELLMACLKYKEPHKESARQH